MWKDFVIICHCYSVINLSLNSKNIHHNFSKKKKKSCFVKKFNPVCDGTRRLRLLLGLPYSHRFGCHGSFSQAWSWLRYSGEFASNSWSETTVPAVCVASSRVTRLFHKMWHFVVFLQVPVPVQTRSVTFDLIVFTEHAAVLTLGVWPSDLFLRYLKNADLKINLG